MDSRPSLTEDDFSCPVCCDIFREPLLLTCSHSICKSCLHTFWQQRGAPECPICRGVSSTPEPPVNIVLHNMCQAVLKERNRRMSVEMEGLCSIHREALTLFCVKDQRPICTKCKNSRLHSRHTVCSIHEASQDLKVWRQLYMLNTLHIFLCLSFFSRILCYVLSKCMNFSQKDICSLYDPLTCQVLSNRSSQTFEFYALLIAPHAVLGSMIFS